MSTFLVSRMVMYIQYAQVEAESVIAAEKILEENRNDAYTLEWGDKQYAGTDYYEVVEEEED